MIKLLIIIFIINLVRSSNNNVQSNTRSYCKYDFVDTVNVFPRKHILIKPNCFEKWNTFSINIKFLSDEKKYSVYILSIDEYGLFLLNNNTVINRNNTREVVVIREFLTTDFNKTTWYNQELPNNPHIVIRNDMNKNTDIYYNISFYPGSYFYLLVFGIVFGSIFSMAIAFGIMLLLVLTCFGLCFLLGLCASKN